MTRRKSWAAWFPVARKPDKAPRYLYGYPIETAEDEIAWQACADGHHMMTLGWLMDKAASRPK